MQHLRERHSLSLQEDELTFNDESDFESWRALDKRSVLYAFRRSNLLKSGKKEMYYNCNRSNSIGKILDTIIM